MMISNSIWKMITHTGSDALILPVAALIFVQSLATRQLRAGFIWAGCFVLGLMLVAMSKIAFVGWGIANCTTGYTGISGHAMRSAAVFPVLGFLLAIACSKKARWFGFAIGMSFAILVAVSRIVLHAHSIIEVILGLVLGAGLSTFALQIAPMNSIVPNSVSTWQRTGILWIACIPVVWASLLIHLQTPELLAAVVIEIPGTPYPFYAKPCVGKKN